jgi:hypothetical protein
MKRLVLAALVALTLVGCDREITINLPAEPTPTAPTVVKSTIEFRVVGNPTSVRVRYSTPVDGLIQFVTTLPYSSSFVTTSDALFLSLEVTPISYSAGTLFPFLSIQIVVNSTTFREATSNEFALNTLSINGTWRR